MNKQIQLKISLSPQLNVLVQKKAKRLGLPVTQYVKYLIIKEIEEPIPTFWASDKTIKRTEEAMKNIDKAVTINNIEKLDELCKE